MIVAVAEHARLGRQLGDDRRQLLAQRRAASVGEPGAAVGLEEVLHEEVHLPGQLLHVERDAVRDERGAREFLAAPLHRVDEADGLPVERRVRRGRAGAHVRLQRDVAQILEREDAEIVGVAEDARHRHRHRGKQACTLTNGSAA